MSIAVHNERGELVFHDDGKGKIVDHRRSPEQTALLTRRAELMASIELHRSKALEGEAITAVLPAAEPDKPNELRARLEGEAAARAGSLAALVAELGALDQLIEKFEP